VRTSDLQAAVGDELAAQRERRIERAVAANPYAAMAGALDEAAAQADADPEWLAGQPEHTRTAVNAWRAHRAAQTTGEPA
jgi:hypothetical protein